MQHEMQRQQTLIQQQEGATQRQEQRLAEVSQTWTVMGAADRFGIVER